MNQAVHITNHSERDKVQSCAWVNQYFPHFEFSLTFLSIAKIDTYYDIIVPVIACVTFAYEDEVFR